MSTPEQNPPAPQPPTPADVQAIMQAAENAARQAVRAEQENAARDAAASTARDRFPGIPDDVVKQISDASAKATVEAIRAEFDLAGNPPAPAPGASTTPPEPATPAPPSPAPPPVVRPSIAQRILGGG